MQQPNEKRSSSMNQLVEYINSPITKLVGITAITCTVGFYVYKYIFKPNRSLGQLSINSRSPSFLVRYYQENALQYKPNYSQGQVSGLSNHLSMTLHAFSSFNATQQHIDSFTKNYRKKLVKWGPSAISSPDPTDFSKSREQLIYQSESHISRNIQVLLYHLNERGVQQVLFEQLPKILSNPYFAGFHGLVRFSYALSICAPKAIDQQLISEIAASIAYWASSPENSIKPYVEDDPVFQSTSIADLVPKIRSAFSSLSFHNIERSLIVKMLSALHSIASEKKYNIYSMLQINNNPRQALLQIAEYSLRLLCSDDFPIDLLILHQFTATQALYSIVDHPFCLKSIDPQIVHDSISKLWYSWVLIFLLKESPFLGSTNSSNSTGIEDKYHKLLLNKKNLPKYADIVRKPLLTWDDIKSLAPQQTNPHVVKLIYSVFLISKNFGNTISNQEIDRLLRIACCRALIWGM